MVCHRGANMTHYLNLDVDGYVLSVSGTENECLTPADIELTDYDLSGERLSCHRWANGALTFDAGKYETLTKVDEAAAEIARLRTELAATDGVILSALENFLSCTTETDLVAAIGEATATHNDIIASRAAIREKITQLEEKT